MILSSDNNTPPPAPHRGGLFLCHPGRPLWAAMSLYFPPAFRRLCGLLWPPGGIFAPVSSGAERAKKGKTAVKTICKPVERFLCLAVFLYSQGLKRRTAAHREPHRAQSNPGPLQHGASRGFVIYCGPGIGWRSGSYQRPTRHKTSGRTQYPLAFYLFSLD